MNIAIIEKNKLYRESLRTVLNQVPDFNVVCDSDDCCSLAQFLKTENIDLILLDYDIAEEKLNQISEQAEILFPNITVIIISNYRENCYFKDFNDYGISDIIFKSAEKKEFEKKIRYAVK